MIRFFAMTSCLLSLTLAVLAAQDPAKGPGKEPEPILKKKTKKDDEPELKKIDPAKDPKDKKEDPKDKKDEAKDKKDAKEPDDAEDRVNAEMKKLEGTWQVVSSAKNGKPAPQEVIKIIRMSFKGGKHTVYFGEEAVTKDLPFTIDPTKNPKTKVDKVPDGREVKGIYKLEGDTLTNCVAEPGKDYPSEFVSQPGSGHTLRVFKRVKKDPKEPELKKIEPGDVPAIGNREKREDIIARIDKNLKAAADDLKKFADDPTRKKQRDIVKDLDDLINQQDEDNKNNSGGGAGGQGGNQGNAGNQGGGGQGGGQANRGGRGRRGGGAGGKGNAGNQGGNGGVGQQKKEPNGGQEKKDPKGGNNTGQANKDPKSGKEVGGGNPPPPDNTKPKNAGDMKTNFWGDLPKHKRLEMDAHLQDRFLDRYESVIRQYFTTIGEKKLGSDKK